nr:unnamed protein product [Spirometra erinaceieuropaei]
MVLQPASNEKTHIPAQFKFAVNADLRRRRSSLPKLLMLARNVHRICLANLLTLRESTSLLIRRLVDLHRSGYFLSSQEKLVTRSHRFLLGACLISFAQDIISEEEMIETAASFEISKFNRDLEKQAKKATPESASVESSQALPVSSNAQQSYQPQEFNALQGPITLHIRQTRRAILEKCRELFDKLNQRTVIMPVESEVAVVEPPKTPEVKLFDLVGNLSPDGSGFVDSEWELVVEKPHLRLWRRPLGRKPASPLLSDEVEHLSFFEYRDVVIPRLLEQLHTAAQRITSSGLPPGITPVFLHLTAPASPDRGASEDEPSTPPVVRSETDRQQPTEDPSTSETVHVLPSAGLFAEVTQDNSYQLFVS